MVIKIVVKIGFLILLHIATYNLFGWWGLAMSVGAVGGLGPIR